MAKMIVYLLVDFGDDVESHQIDTSTLESIAETAFDEVDWVWEDYDHPKPEFSSAMGSVDVSEYKTIAVRRDGSLLVG